MVGQSMDKKEKIVCVIMGQNCEKFMGMCLESVKDADAIVYCDGRSTESCRDHIFRDVLAKTMPDVYENKFTWIENPYDQEDKQMNGKQRNFYLDYVKKNYPDHWCLAIDADEVVEDLSKIKDFIQKARAGIYSVHMRHFHNDLGHEDATQEKHWVMNRLFKVSEASHYPEVEHPVLNPPVDEDKVALTHINSTDCTTIWHLAHINHCFNIKNRYEKNIKHSNMHTTEFLDNWKDAHIFGTYPNKPVQIIDIPPIILKYFHVNIDKYYFQNRGVELKHPLQVKQWADYFKPKSILDLGCGRGPYLHFWHWFVQEAHGRELSQWAVQNAFCKNVWQGDISIEGSYIPSDLITAIDVLEHLDDDHLMFTLEHMQKYGKKFLFSIPFVGDPNLLNDKTHKQFRTKEQWVKLIESFDIKIKDAPKEWLFANQILIGEKNEKTED